MSPVPQGTAEFIAHIFQPSLRGLGVFLKHPQHFVLGYFQSSRLCRDSLALCRKTFPGKVRGTADPSAALGMTKGRAELRSESDAD
jgi:hypothetical protein